MPLTDRINLTTTLGGNTGKTSGDVRMGRISALLLTREKEFSAAERADVESFEEALQESILLSRTDANKIFVFTGFREVEDTTGDPATATLADGYEEVLTDPLVKAVLRHTKGAAETQSLVAFNGWNDRVYVVDDKKIVWGLSTTDGGMRGFSVGFLYSQAPKFGGSGAINTNQVRITLGDADEFKSAGLVALKLDTAISAMDNLIDVDLLEVAAASGYAFKIGAYTKYAGTNIYDNYADALEDDAAWVATIKTTGASVGIASVAKDATNKGWTVTLESTPTIAAGVEIYINLVDPTALAALTIPVTGIEATRVKVTKPA